MTAVLQQWKELAAAHQEGSGQKGCLSILPREEPMELTLGTPHPGGGEPAWSLVASAQQWLSLSGLP